MEQAVFQTLKKQLELTLSCSTDDKAQTGYYVAERSEYERQVESLENDKQNLFERFVMGEIDMDTYKAEKSAYDEIITRTNNAFAAIATQAKQKQEEQERQNSRGEIWSAITESTGLTPELTDLLIEKVMVYPDNRLDIIYKVKDLFE